ncbi:MAG: amidase [Myxococcota bacterium]
MSFDDVLAATALEQAHLIRTRQLSSEELTRATLERIDARNGHLHAFVRVFHRRALRTAKAKDAMVKRGEPLPVFHGVPIGIKDLNFVRFSRTSMGSRGALPLISPVDDKSAASARRGGFVFVGKTATSEVGAMPVTEPDIHEATANPWNPLHTAGGSSGGAAASVAGGLLSIAHGSDGGGSIRLPSGFCHLFGHKPSRGRVPNAFGAPDKEILYTCGPLAQSVADAAAFLDVLAGLDIGRPHWAPPPARRYLDGLAPPSRPLRIRFTTVTPLGPTDPEVAAAVVRTAKLLADQGHHVEEGTMPSATLEEFLPVWQRLISGVPLIRWSRAQPITKWLREVGARLDPEQVLKTRRELERRFLTAFDEVDVWLTPTSPTPAPRIGAFTGDKSPEQGFAEAAVLGSFTAIFNVTGQPAASVPSGLSSRGLPMGVQVAGKPFADDVVLSVSRQLEELMPWRQRRAPLA